MKNNPVIYDLQKVLLTTIQDVLPVCVKDYHGEHPFIKDLSAIKDILQNSDFLILQNKFHSFPRGN